MFATFKMPNFARGMTLGVALVAFTTVVARAQEVPGPVRTVSLNCNNLPAGVTARATLDWATSAGTALSSGPTLDCDGDLAASADTTQPLSVYGVDIQDSIASVTFYDSSGGVLGWCGPNTYGVFNAGQPQRFRLTCDLDGVKNAGVVFKLGH